MLTNTVKASSVLDHVRLRISTVDFGSRACALERSISLEWLAKFLGCVVFLEVDIGLGRRRGVVAIDGSLGADEWATGVIFEVVTHRRAGTICKTLLKKSDNLADFICVDNLVCIIWPLLRRQPCLLKK
jgi:hypothetical protein